MQLLISKTLNIFFIYLLSRLFVFCFQFPSVCMFTTWSISIFYVFCVHDSTALSQFQGLILDTENHSKWTVSMLYLSAYCSASLIAFIFIDFYFQISFMLLSWKMGTL